MFDIETLKFCSILQACEWIAFGWEPTTQQYEEMLGRHRPLQAGGWAAFERKPATPEYDNTLGYSYQESINPNSYNEFYKPILPFTEYAPEIQKACAKLTIALQKKYINALGILYKQDMDADSLFDAPVTIIDCVPGTRLYFETNEILSDNNRYGHIVIDTKVLQKLFPAKNAESSPVKFKITLDKNGVWLHTGKIQKTNIKNFKSSNSKSQRVIEHILQHPNRLITMQEIKQLGIKGFDETDRLDVIVKNAFSRLDNYKVFFPELHSHSVMFKNTISCTELSDTNTPYIIVK